MSRPSSTSTESRTSCGNGSFVACCSGAKDSPLDQRRTGRSWGDGRGQVRRISGLQRTHDSALVPIGSRLIAQLSRQLPLPGWFYAGASEPSVSPQIAGRSALTVSRLLRNTSAPLSWARRRRRRCQLLDSARGLESVKARHHQIPRWAAALRLTGLELRTILPVASRVTSRRSSTSRTRMTTCLARICRTFAPRSCTASVCRALRGSSVARGLHGAGFCQFGPPGSLGRAALQIAVRFPEIFPRNEAGPPGSASATW